MAVSPFVATQWQPLDLLDESKMDDMANGIQYVHDNTPRARFNVGSAYGRSQGIKIASGRKSIPRNMKKYQDSVTVNFGNFFTAGCSPLVTTGVMSPMQSNIFATFRGLSRVEPDHNGMVLEIEIGQKEAAKPKIRRSFAVHWIAMGW